MPLFDFFKRKPKKEEKKSVIPSRKVEEKPALPKKIPEKAKLEKQEKTLKIAKKKAIETYRLLKSPHVTEKGTDLAEKNQYVFQVWPQANKTQIKKAIESLYGVDVVSVRVVKTPAKKRRIGRISGWRPGFKKAIIRIKEGQKIEVLPR